MNEIVLKETNEDFLFPFSATRSVLDIRIGILTLREKWKLFLGKDIQTDNQDKSIPANIIPSEKVIQELQQGKKDFSADEKLSYPWQIFQLTDKAIRNDFALLTKDKKSASIPSTNRIVASEKIFVEEGAKIEHAILNASTGPIYISKNAEIMEGSMIRGPFFLGEESVVKMGAKIYGATSVGKKCVVGGETKNAVFFDYSNKAHDGYIGDSVIGSWCNLGAGTSNSNIKNNATNVKVRSALSNQFENVGQKCGLLMGDYSRCAINTSFNTGTVVGVCCNVFGNGLSPKFIPSFSWGLDDAKQYEFEKAISDISNWKKLKNEMLSDIEIQNLKHIFEKS